MIGRILAFVYGLACYAMALAVFIYLAAFLANFYVPKTVNSGEAGPFGQALIINILLLAVFGLQHSIMARPTFKNAWTKVVPKPVERSTYLLLSNLVMILLFWQWQPMTGVVWTIGGEVGRTVVWALYAIGWGVLLLSTFLINHFDLFGLRQIWLNLRNQEYTSLTFKTPGPYQLIRHPIYLGWLIVFWAAPTMTVGHLVLALGMTVYIFIAIWFEERNLVDIHPEYAEYKSRSSMILPIGFGKGSSGSGRPEPGA